MTGVLALTVGFGERSLEAHVSPTSVMGGYYGSSGTPQDISTGGVIGSATGGRAPYTYAWTQEDSSPDVWTISAPTSANTGFTATAINPGAPAYASFRFTVTDAAGLTAYAIVPAQANNRSTA